MKLLSPQELEAALRDMGARRYHRAHPFHHLLHSGKCSKGQVQAWALNRYYYQAMIPIKDASLIARCPDSDIRREWRRRLVDHDGVHRIDCSGVELPYGRQLVYDIRERTETAMPQARCFQAMEIALKAQALAERT